MIIQKMLFLLFLCFCMVVNVPIVLGAQTIYVSGDSTGNYKCDGKDDQVQINQALEYAANNPGTKVYLKGRFTYDIRGSCLIGSNTELTGDSTAKLRLANRVGWTKVAAGTPVIGQRGSAVHDIKIHGFEIDGNEGAQSGPGGRDLYRLISFSGSTSAPVCDIYVYNMNLHDAKGEGFRVTNGKDIYYYNNIGGNLQHCVVMYSRVKGGEIRDNVARQCSCAGDRLDSCQDITIKNEKISPFTGTTTYSKNSRGCAVSDNGIQIANVASTLPTKNIVVQNCDIVSGVNGIQLDVLNDGSNVKIINNNIHDSGYESEAVTRNGGISITGCGDDITISNNDITNVYNHGINIDKAISGTHTVKISYNNIVNGKSFKNKPYYGIYNCAPSNVKLSLDHNYISGYKTPIYPQIKANINSATSMNSNLASETTIFQYEFIESFSSFITSAFEEKLQFGDRFSPSGQNSTQVNSNLGQSNTSPGVQVPELPFIVVIAVALGLLAIFERRKL